LTARKTPSAANITGGRIPENFSPNGTEVKISYEKKKILRECNINYWLQPFQI
jgi:hypothetical protein